MERNSSKKSESDSKDSKNMLRIVIAVHWMIVEVVKILSREKGEDTERVQPKP
jgi:hypothetical protein